MDIRRGSKGIRLVLGADEGEDATGWYVDVTTFEKAADGVGVIVKTTRHRGPKAKAFFQAYKEAAFRL